jgi:hypothetical protein
MWKKDCQKEEAIMTSGRTAVVLTIAFLGGSSIAIADECSSSDFGQMKVGLEWVVNDPGARACAVDRVLHKSEAAYDAFAHCNDKAFYGDGLIGSTQLNDKYVRCAPEVCSWLKAQNPPWSPAC